MASIKTIVYYPDKKDDKRLSKIPEQLPMPCFRWLFVSQSGAGKTNIIKNILFNPKFGYKNYFDEIYVYIGSKDDEKEYKRLAEENGMKDKIELSEEYNDDDLRELYEEIEEENGTAREQRRILMVFDDMIFNGISKQYKTTQVDKLFMAGRHNNISCILVSQKYKSLNRNLRMANATAITIFTGCNIQEIAQICDEHCANHDPKQMFDTIVENLKTPFSYTTIDRGKTYDKQLKDKEWKIIPLD